MFILHFELFSISLEKMQTYQNLEVLCLAN